MWQIRKIVSGGQTGADRAALDFAIDNNIDHGGWCPEGRQAEDGVIRNKYRLTETPGSGYSRRTRRNVQDSDGTLILNLGKLQGGTLATRILCRKLEKPCLLLQVDDGVGEKEIASVSGWIDRSNIRTLNVAGPRESKRPGIYHQTYTLLSACAGAQTPVGGSDSDKQNKKSRMKRGGQ